MPEELDEIPDKPAGRKIAAHEIFPPTPRRRGSAPTSRVSFSEYERMLKRRPDKFSREEVDYRPAEEPGTDCESCIHFYQQVAGEKRTVCEILRLDPEEPIDPAYVCQFTTHDGVNYPYQGKVSGRSKVSSTGD